MADALVTYSSLQLSLAPAYLKRGKWGQTWFSAFGLSKDALVDLVTQATSARLIRSAPLDALPFIGQERRLEQLPGEDAGTTYRARLGKAFTTYRQGDNDGAVIDALALLGFTARIKRNNQWDWDGHPGNVPGYWARMWVIIDYPNSFTVGDAWGSSFKWGSSRWGINGITDAQILAIRRLVKKWSGSHSLIPAIILRIGPTGGLWGDTFVWGSSTWGGGDSAPLEGW